MGIFGEAIHGHIGSYKTDIYGAAINAGQLVQAQGLSEQDVNNVILSTASFGQNDSENQIIMFDPDGRGVSWTLRIASQTGVSAGYSHIAYWQSTLSAFRNIDTMVYFPFITDEDVLKQLLQQPGLFNPSRWSRCMQNVHKKKAYQMQLLGSGFNLPRNLLKKTVCYILSKLDTRARKYLYILVPQGAPYQAYCEAVIWHILSVIPIGLRRGLTFSTNPAQRDEDSFGIIFQQEANPARHGCDLSFHRNGNYEFLNDYYLNKNLENLISLFVENPEMTEVCYQEMEQPIFGDRLPENMTPYDSYYGISQLHTNKDRPEYLEDCNTLLGQTKQNPQQRKLTENAIRTEINSAASCLSYIEKDKDYISAIETNGINEYLKRRRNLIEYLSTIGIDFNALFLYKKLEEICRRKNLHSAEEIYREIVLMRSGLTEVTESEKDRCCNIAWEKAWKEFEEYLPPHNIGLPLTSENKPYYTPEITRQLLTDTNPVSGWSANDALEHFRSLTEIAPVDPPVNMGRWYYWIKRVEALSTLFEIERVGDINRCDLQIVQNCLDVIFEYSARDGSMQNTVEAGTALDCVQHLYKMYRNQFTEAHAALEIEKNLIGIHRRCAMMYGLRREIEDYSLYESALWNQMVSYLSNSSEPTLYKNAVAVAATELTGIKDAYMLRVNETAAAQINNNRLSDFVKIEIYNAVKAGQLYPQLQETYEAWVYSKFMDGISDTQMLEDLYASVLNPSPGLTNEYTNWKRVVSEKRGIEEIVMTSRTYVRYLKAVSMRGASTDEAENQRLRGKLWNQLIHEERDISAFLGAVAYFYNCEPIEFLMSENPNAQKALEELRYFIGNDGNHMGILLTEEESFQELYMKAVCYNQFASNAIKIPLYSLKEFDSLNDLGKLEDAAGKIATAKIYSIIDVIEVLKSLIQIQNKLYSREDADAVISKLENNSAKDILRFFDEAGVFKNKDNLDEAFKAIRFTSRGRESGEQKEGSSILKYVPYIGWGVAAMLLIILISVMIFSKKASEPPVEPAFDSVTESVTVGDDSAETAESSAIIPDSEITGVAENEESTIAVGESTAPESETPAPQATEETPDSQNANPADETENQTVPTDPTFIDGKLVSNRINTDNRLANFVKEGDYSQGYDLNGDGVMDLYAIYTSVLEGFGFKQKDSVDIRAIRDSGYIIGYDTNGDGNIDSQPVKGGTDEVNGVDIDRDGIQEIGFDFDGDGLCEIGFDC